MELRELRCRGGIFGEVDGISGKLSEFEKVEGTLGKLEDVRRTSGELGEPCGSSEKILWRN